MPRLRELKFDGGDDLPWVERACELYEQIEAARNVLRGGGPATRDEELIVAVGFSAAIESIWGRQVRVPVGAKELVIDGERFSFGVEALVLHRVCGECGATNAYTVGSLYEIGLYTHWGPCERCDLVGTAIVHVAEQEPRRMFMTTLEALGNVA